MKLQDIFGQFKNTFASIFAIALAIMTLIGMFYGFDLYIDMKVEQKINNYDFINKLSSSINPTVIFDITGIVIYERGGMKYIDDITIQKIITIVK